jgi:hypothetical protein
MRRLVRFVLASAMMVGGLYLLVADLLLAARWYAWAIVAGAVLLIVGAYLLPVSGNTENRE